MPRITPFLWFDTNAEEAANFYVSIFPNSKITATSYYGDAGPGRAGSVLTIDFELDGQPFIALNGGPSRAFSEAISFSVDCTTQEEVDRYYEALSAGGEEQPCAWLKDRFGLSWQIVPRILSELLQDKDPVKANRVMQAMFTMTKIDIARLQAAHAGT